MFGIKREINISKSYILLSPFINKKDKDKDKKAKEDLI